MVVGWVRFVTRTEVKNLSATAVIAASASENLAALKPADEHQLVGRRHIEAFTVHFFFIEHNALADSFCNGMRWVDNPKALFFLSLPPLEITRSSHQTPENFAVVSAVQDDEAHTGKHPVINAIDDVVGDFVMCEMSPPKQHIGLSQPFFGQTVLVFVERSRFNRETRHRSQIRCDGTVDSVRIDAGDDLILFLMPIFVPYNHANVVRHIRSAHTS